VTIRTATTPDGHVVGWDICGNPSCHKHIDSPDVDDKICPNHPVMPSHLKRKVEAKTGMYIANR
jgi:hypothetical protein